MFERLIKERKSSADAAARMAAENQIVISSDEWERRKVIAEAAFNERRRAAFNKTADESMKSKVTISSSNSDQVAQSDETLERLSQERKRSADGNMDEYRNKVISPKKKRSVEDELMNNTINARRDQCRNAGIKGMAVKLGYNKPKDNPKKKVTYDSKTVDNSTFQNDIIEINKLYAQNDIKCCFYLCEKKKINNFGGYLRHPLVTRNYDGDKLYLCNVCHFSWSSAFSSYSFSQNKLSNSSSRPSLLEYETLEGNLKKVIYKPCSICMVITDQPILCSNFNCKNTFCNKCLDYNDPNNNDKCRNPDGEDWYCWDCKNDNL